MNGLFFKAILTSSIVFCLFSCTGLHIGSMSGSANLNAANFSYVNQNIRGEAEAKYILGIGGMNPETLVDNAKQQMLAANPLKSNQALANVTVNFKSSFYMGFFYYKTKCIVTADVVEFK